MTNPWTSFIKLTLGEIHRASHKPLMARFMGPTWGRQDPGGPHVGPMNFAIWANYWFKLWLVSSGNKPLPEPKQSNQTHPVVLYHHITSLRPPWVNVSAAKHDNGNSQISDCMQCSCMAAWCHSFYKSISELAGTHKFTGIMFPENIIWAGSRIDPDHIG